MKRRYDEFDSIDTNCYDRYSCQEISELWDIALERQKSFHTLALACPVSFLENLYSKSKSSVRAGIPVLSRMIRERTNSLACILHGNDLYTEEVLYQILFFPVQELFSLECIRARTLQRGNLYNALRRKSRRNWSYVLAAFYMRKLLKLFIEDAYSPDSWYIHKYVSKRFQNRIQSLSNRASDCAQDIVMK
jgi:hypothetical protein